MNQAKKNEGKKKELYDKATSLNKTAGMANSMSMAAKGKPSTTAKTLKNQADMIYGKAQKASQKSREDAKWEVSKKRDDKAKGKKS